MLMDHDEWMRIVGLAYRQGDAELRRLIEERQFKSMTCTFPDGRQVHAHWWCDFCRSSPGYSDAERDAHICPVLADKSG